MSSRIQAFLAQRSARWAELTRLLLRLENEGPRALSPDEVLAIGRLYRATASDLARARTLGVQGEALEQLNALVARVHIHLYRGRPHHIRQLLEFCLIGFPQLFRRTAGFTLAALLIFSVPCATTYVAVRDDPTLTYTLLSPEMRANADAFEDAPSGSRNSTLGLMASSFYFTNNTSVAFRAFAGGITAGVFTTVVLISNGLQLGATAALVEYLKSQHNFWAFVSPHGTLELLAIFLAGGAGLKIGLAILQPGDRSRREALVINGREGVQMALGAAMMLFWAGLTEGFVSPSMLSNDAKYALGLFNAALLFGYLGAGDRLGARLLDGR